MPERRVRALFELNVRPKADGSRGAARSLHQQLIEAIDDGRLARGMRLPSTRDARSVFGVSRNTLADVYDRLLHEGYVVMRRRSGTFVADKVPESPAVHQPGDAPPYRLNPYWLQADVQDAINFWRERPPDQPRAGQSPCIDLRAGQIDPSLFPMAVFRRAVSKQLRSLERRPLVNTSSAGEQGSRRLREAISGHIRVTRAVVCRPDDVLVTSGAQQAFDLLARALVTPGETTVALEDPGYPPVRAAFGAAAAKLVPVPVDQEGISVDHLPRDARIIYVCPSHQFPLGVAMSERRREQLVRFARAHGAVIVEDDYDGEFRHDGSPLQALRMRDCADVVFYVGTFSKCMLSSLRLGFIVAPRWALPALVTVKNCLDWHSPILMQLALAEFIAAGHLTLHVRKMRSIYAQRRKQLQQILREDFSDWLEAVPSSYGMHLCALSRGGLDAGLVAAAATRQGIEVHSLDRYYMARSGRPGLLFGYGAADASQIERAMQVLRGLIRG